jgi:hypothetical protein
LPLVNFQPSRVQSIYSLVLVRLAIQQYQAFASSNCILHISDSLFLPGSRLHISDVCKSQWRCYACRSCIRKRVEEIKDPDASWFVPLTLECSFFLFLHTPSKSTTLETMPATEFPIAAQERTSHLSNPSPRFLSNSNIALSQLSSQHPTNKSQPQVTHNPAPYSTPKLAPSKSSLRKPSPQSPIPQSFQPTPAA